MTYFQKIARYILGIDHTETSEQEKFIKDLYLTQKNIVKPINKKHISTFIESILDKHDLLHFGLVLNKQVLAKDDEFDKKEILKYADFFDTVKSNLRNKIVLLHDNPWIGLFEKDSLVFVTKKEVKLSDIEINAIAHDVLNSKELFVDEKAVEYEIAKRQTT